MRERKREGDKGEREREKVAYPGQNNYLPFLHAEGTFSPLKTWEGEPPLEVCELPPTGHVYVHGYTCYTRAHILRVVHACACVPSIHTGVFLILSTNITASPRDRGRVLALWVQHDGNTMKQTGERRVCACTHTGWHVRAMGKGEREREGRGKERGRGERERERSIRDGKKYMTMVEK